MNVLLTGATGLLGNNTLRALLPEGHRVTCLLRAHDKPPALADLDVELVYGDLADSESLVAASFPDFDVMIHCAALIHLGWSRLDESRRINVDATRRLAEICLTRNKRMLHVSTVDTLGYSADGTPIDEAHRGFDNPPSTYVLTKTEGDSIIDQMVLSGLDAVVVHPGFMIGPYDWKVSSGQMLLGVQHNRIPYAPGGGCSAVDVRDVARGIMLAMTEAAAGEHFILAGQNVTYLELFQMISQTIGRKGPRWRFPDWLAMSGGRVADLIGKLRGREFVVNSASARMGQCFHYYDSGKAQRDLGYTIGPLQPAIDDAWRWLNSFKNG